MPRDKRLYLQLALDFLENPKVRVLSDRAKVTLLSMLLYSAKHKLDGRFTTSEFKTFGTPAVRRELMSNHRERPSVVEHDGAFWLHDYDKHNRLAADIERISRARSASGKQGGEAKTKLKQIAKQGAKQIATHAAPHISRSTEDNQDLTVHPDLSSTPHEDDMSQLDPVIAAVVRATAKGGLRISPLGAPSLIQFIDDRRGPRAQPIKLPIRYYPNAISESWAEVSKFIHEEGIAS